MPERTHKCPAPGCTADVPRSQLACRPHWYSIPSEIRSRLWSGYRSGNTVKHSQAMADAVAFLRAEPATADGGRL
jgi:hypothetical protein